MRSVLNTAKILIVDDHPLVCEGLAMLLGAQRDLEVCGVANDEKSALRLYREQHPALTIVDISLASGYGINLIKEILACDSHAKTLVISGYDASLYAELSLRAGAFGYLNKQELNSKMIDAIRTILQGGRLLASGELDFQTFRNGGAQGAGSDDPINRLTCREQEVFSMIGHGLTSAEITHQLNLSMHTVDTHRERIRQKIAAKSSAELIRLAVQWVLENH